MITSIELQVISKLLTTDNPQEIDALLAFDSTYYSVFKEHIEFIQEHYRKYDDVPDVFTFQAQFPDITLVTVSEPLSYLTEEMAQNKQYIIMLETFNKLKDLGSGDVKEAWEYLRNQCDRVQQLESTNPMDIVHDAKVRADQIIEFNRQKRIPTGFPEIDKMMYGGLSTVEELLIILARTNTGKAQPLWSKVLTPFGWVRIGNIRVGDTVVGKNNDNGKVVAIFPQGVKPYFTIHFDDGTHTDCCDDHLWEVYSGGKYSVVTTNEIRQSSAEFFVDLCGEIDVNYHHLPFVRNHRYDEATRMLEKLAAYYASDDDGNEYFELDPSVNRDIELYDDAFRAMGYKVCPSVGEDKMTRVYVDRTLRKKIVSIEYAGETECQCILVGNNSHTYITDNYIVTHNTWVTTKMMESAQKSGFPVLYYSPEMQSSFIGTRFDTWRAHFQNSQLYQGKYDAQYFDYIKNLTKEETGAYVLEDKDVAEGVVNVPALETMVKRLGIKLLIIDGLSYMADSRKSDTDYVKYKNICTDLFRLSKKYGCAVVISMQANRETRESKDDKGEPFPNLYNVEGSDHPARIATQAFSLRQVFDKHVLDIRLEKSRMANNQKPICSYAWDPNTGNMQYLPGGEDDQSAPPPASMPPVNPNISTHIQAPSDVPFDLDDDDDDVEF